MRGSAVALALCAALNASAKDDQRIVTVGGAATESVFALGAGDRVVAVDLSSTYPEQVRALPQVGYIRNISPEGILSMKPDLIVTTESLGPPAAKSMMKQLKMPIVWLPEPNSVEALEESLNAVAAKVGGEDKAKEIIAGVNEAVENAQADSATWAKKPSVVFFMEPPGAGSAGMAGGEETRSAELIKLAGGENAVTGFKNFQTMSIESLIEIDPDVIIVGMSAGHGTTPEGLAAFKQLPGVASTNAVKNGAIYGVPLDDLNFGPRLGDAVTRWHGHFAEVAE
ncbi:MAG: heme/hemin ABC transporter substrate-binding protein [Puniceicoccales bacterium]